MNKYDFENMDDDEFSKLFESFDKKMDEFLEKDDFYNRYIAYYIAEEYKQDLLANDSLEVVIKSALNNLSVITPSKEKIELYLKEKYNLEVTDETNLKLEEL